MNLIGDIAGNFNTLMALLKKMPDEEVVSLGDMVDRGPRSRQVVEWFQANGKALKGNHEHMMLDAYYGRGYYEPGLWVQVNGGFETLLSFGFENQGNAQIVDLDVIPAQMAEWLDQLPLFVEFDGLFISHAPRHPVRTISAITDLGEGYYKTQNSRKDWARMDDTLIWNRGKPRRLTNQYQVHGHNACRVVNYYRDSDGEYGVNIDTSKGRVLTGLHWPTKKIYQQDWIDYKTLEGP